MVVSVECKSFVGFKVGRAQLVDGAMLNEIQSKFKIQFW